MPSLNNEYIEYLVTAVLHDTALINQPEHQKLVFYSKQHEYLFSFTHSGVINVAQTDKSIDCYNSNTQTGYALKTFIVNHTASEKTEKITELNKFSENIRNLQSSEEKARAVADSRNMRIKQTMELYNLKTAVFQLITRYTDCFQIHELPLNYINSENLTNIKEKTGTSLAFKDGLNEYNYNFSKSVLMQTFNLTNIEPLVTIYTKRLDSAETYAVLKSRIIDHYQLNKKFEK